MMDSRPEDFSSGRPPAPYGTHFQRYPTAWSGKPSHFRIKSQGVYLTAESVSMPRMREEREMLPYFALIALGLAGEPLLSRHPEYRRKFLLLFGLACWLLASLRYVTGFDYRSYEAVFQKIAGQGLASLTAREPGYFLLNWTTALWGGGYRAFLFLVHLLVTALVLLWIGRYSSAPWLSVYLFVTLQYFAMSMNLLRQSIAAAIVLWTYPFLRRRRFLPFCGIVLLASCFHQSALFMFPLYVLLNLRVSKRHYTAAAAIAGLAYLFADPLLQLLLTVLPVYRSYPGGRYWQGNSAVYLLAPLGCFFFSLPLIRQAVRNPSASPVLANSAFYSLLIQMFITRHFILERLSIYTAFFSILALPEAVREVNGGRRAKVWTILLAACCLAYFIFAAQQGFHGVYPYHGIWSRAASSGA